MRTVASPVARLVLAAWVVVLIRGIRAVLRTHIGVRTVAPVVVHLVVHVCSYSVDRSLIFFYPWLQPTPVTHLSGRKIRPSDALHRIDVPLCGRAAQ
jgi:hypothetical protein